MTSGPAGDGSEAEPAVLAALRGAGILPPKALVAFLPLTGGVSSDILKIECGDVSVVVKRALPQLRVSAEWKAPIERNRYEVAWLRSVARFLPDAVPRILGVFPEQGFFAMEYLDPERYPNWKSELRDGRVDAVVAELVGRRLAAIHAATAHDAGIAGSFATDHIFRPIRLEPYLEATALRHPEVAETLRELSASTLANRMALVHGDVSPKNILVGPKGPVFVDAECAWFGDPAFDVAFCLNHLLLKCLWNPAARRQFVEAFDTLWAAYSIHVSWEPVDGIARRAGRLLAAFLLARVDGKSPVEYLTQETQRAFVRSVALPLIAAPPASPTIVRDAWAGALELGVGT